MEPAEGTRIADVAGGASDEVWAGAAKRLAEDQLAALVARMAIINAFG